MGAKSEFQEQRALIEDLYAVQSMLWLLQYTLETGEAPRHFLTLNDACLAHTFSSIFELLRDKYHLYIEDAEI